MSDRYSDMQSRYDGSGVRCAAVTPSDDDDLPFTARFIDVMGAGDVRFTTTGGDTVTFPAIAGQKLTYMIKRVHATGTTATNMFAGQ